MLDLTIAMLQVLLALLILLFQDPPVAITSPLSGATLRGAVTIVGRMNVPNFATAELAFAYAADQTSTWFRLQTFSAPPADPILFTWDTAGISDDDYTLRLRVYLQDGSFQDVLIGDLKVRNDAPPPTETPTPVAENLVEEPLPTPTAVAATATRVFPTPTPLPPNPAALAASSIYSTFGRGAALAMILFLVLGLFLRLRRS